MELPRGCKGNYLSTSHPISLFAIPTSTCSLANYISQYASSSTGDDALKRRYCESSFSVLRGSLSLSVSEGHSPRSSRRPTSKGSEKACLTCALESKGRKGKVGKGTTRWGGFECLIVNKIRNGEADKKAKFKICVSGIDR
ncbi:hypothetical protein L345_15545, partial [Ophiophagus hannah]